MCKFKVGQEVEIDFTARDGQVGEVLVIDRPPDDPPMYLVAIDGREIWYMEKRLRRHQNDK